MEKFLNSLMTRLHGRVSQEDLMIFNEVLCNELKNYDLVPKETAVSVYNGDLPREAKEYLVAKKIEGLTDGTMRTYFYNLRTFFNYVRKSPAEIVTNDIRGFLYAEKVRGIKDITLDGYRISINNLFDWLVQNEYLEKNPCKKLKPIKTERTIKEPLNDIEIEKLRECCQTPREHAIIETLYSTACRVSELVNIKVSDIDINNKEIKVYGKGRKERIVYINAKALIALDDYISSKKYESEYVFSQEQKPHGKLSCRKIQMIVKDLGQRAGITTKVHPHRVRRTTATVALERGMRLEQVQALLGHESPRTTLIYAKINQSDVKISHQKAIV